MNCARLIQLLCLIISVLIFPSCQRTPQRPAALTLTEGIGLDGVCVLQSPVTQIIDVLGKPTLVITHLHEGPIKEKEFTFQTFNVTVDTIDEGAGDSITRVSVLCQNSNQRGGGVHTGKGLNLSDANITRDAIFDRYGKPTNTYESFAEKGITIDIASGTPYILQKIQDGFEYIHYPNTGIAFVLVNGKLTKCSVERPLYRRIWRY